MRVHHVITIFLQLIEIRKVDFLILITSRSFVEPIIAATESDMDGALTMQLFKYMTGKPVLFADVRHYEKSEDVWFFSNSGTSATYFAGGSDHFEDNLKNVSLLPNLQMQMDLSDASLKAMTQCFPVTAPAFPRDRDS